MAIIVRFTTSDPDWARKISQEIENQKGIRQPPYPLTDEDMDCDDPYEFMEDEDAQIEHDKHRKGD